MLQEAVRAWSPAQPARTERSPAYWMELGAKRHAELLEILRPLHDAVQRLEQAVDRLDLKVDRYIAAEQEL